MKCNLHRRPANRLRLGEAINCRLRQRAGLRVASRESLYRGRCATLNDSAASL